MVVSDPQILKHILREKVFNYDKGVLGEVLEDVMGKGLIPADFETWRVRRKAIVPGFHQKWLNFQVSEFGRAGELLVTTLKQAASTGKTIDMEERFGSVALDIIGKSVFNYEFGSVEGESPIVKAAIQSLREVEHRAQTPFQYWKLPLTDLLIERQRDFNQILGRSVAFAWGAQPRGQGDSAAHCCALEALADRKEADLEELENRDYEKWLLAQLRMAAYTGESSKDLCRYCEAVLGKRHLNPRHQCRLCNALVCGSCSPNMVQLDPGASPQRVCNSCVAILPQQSDLAQRLDRLARHLRLQAGHEEADPLESSSNVEDALRRCESLESMLAEERMRLLSKVEEAWDDAVDGLVDGTLM
ncbi:unnamed protein product [Cladocopium goreaui]|uniref:FYVE-type domain-containing protein n=1 Tax=Cladocopium goreaui TaxID=2562237 RepID=A0A9P1G1J8_9DINO|nr:unnamed protein product [Cladocopium goreaui]